MAPERLHANLIPFPGSAALCEEAEIGLSYNGRHVLSFMCTPREIRELAAGWLFTQGLVKSRSEILSIGECVDARAVSVVADPDRWQELEAWKQVVSSGCGGGVMLRASMIGPAKADRGAGLRCSDFPVQKLMRDMLDSASLYRKTGGVHCAALASPECVEALSEDVGRHNAIDKVIGRRLLDGKGFNGLLMLTTGRVSAEIAVKAAKCGVSGVASLSVPTDAAADIAGKAGIFITGRVFSRSPMLLKNDEARGNI